MRRLICKLLGHRWPDGNRYPHTCARCGAPSLRRHGDSDAKWDAIRAELNRPCPYGRVNCVALACDTCTNDTPGAAPTGYWVADTTPVRLIRIPGGEGVWCCPLCGETGNGDPALHYCAPRRRHMVEVYARALRAACSFTLTPCPALPCDTCPGFHAVDGETEIQACARGKAHWFLSQAIKEGGQP